MSYINEQFEIGEIVGFSTPLGLVKVKIRNFNKWCDLVLIDLGECLDHVNINDLIKLK